MVKRINSKISVIFTLTAFIYFLYRALLILQKPIGGDEGLFLSDLNFIKSNGWIDAIEKSISIPYMMLAYPFSFVFENHIALSFVNVLLVIGLFIYLIFRTKNFNKIIGYLLFYIGTVSFFFYGTNDTIFFFCLIIFFNEVFLLTSEGRWKGTLAISMLVVSVFTREMYLVYLPMIIISFFFIIKNRGWGNVNIPVIVAILFFFLLINIPSITKNHKISYDNKLPPTGINATWTQRQYLAQVLVNQGELKNGKHPSWQQTDNYLIENGLDSLPVGVIDGLFFDIELTIKEFYKDFFYSLFFGFRQLGLILFITLFILFKNFKRNTIFKNSMYIPLSLFIVLSTFSLIIISFVELRWFAPIFVLCIIYFNSISSKLNKNIILINYLILMVLTFYGFTKSLGFQVF